MSDLVRVRANGTETNVSRAFAEKRDLQVLDEPTHTRDGRVRRARLSPQKKAAITRAANETSGGNKSSVNQAGKSAETAEEAS